ncbi:primosomal protein N' [Vallicoccus soli]|uniref:Probable replication restart protein PriA n=1 Tax=Vallicoccus soli TaxID=2339232 RepID=A0A3A3Z385_9ACTN|nr:primosomal protein N' [Vallicoccus soli]
MRPTRPREPAAAELPVARVLLDVPLAHLDRPFDYEVGAGQAADAVPGARVRARFAGREVDGFVLERCGASAYDGRLARLSRVVSPEPVLTPAVARLAREVADRWAGTVADVLRLAVPPRHARVEQAQVAPPAPGPDPGPGEDAWAALPDAASYLAALRRGAPARAAWQAAPGQDWPRALAQAARASWEAGRGALLVVPDQRDVDRVDAALAAVLPPGAHVALSAGLTPGRRYRRWLRVLRGEARVVVGPRAATWAPVADPGLLALWDDGDDLHAEPRAPYPHVREVLALRAHLEGSALLVGGHARTAEAQLLVESGWAGSLVAPAPVRRAAAPLVRLPGDAREHDRDPAADSARLPSLAWRTAREALARGPVLVQVPRAGYLPALACQDCRTPQRCAACDGPVVVTGRDRPPACGWCGRRDARTACPVCGSTRLRAVRVGSERTAEELGRAFPGTTVRTSGRGGVLATVGPEPALVVATPGAEPVAEGGYAAALLLDGHLLLARPDLRAGEEALRRWLGAAALVRTRDAGGEVVLLAPPDQPAVQALVRWDPQGAAARELDERRGAHLPPAARVAVLTGPPEEVADLAGAVELPPGAQVLGPAPVEAAPGAPPGADPEVRLVVRVPPPAGRALTAALRAAQAGRSARKADVHVRVQVDPRELG